MSYEICISKGIMVCSFFCCGALSLTTRVPSAGKEDSFGLF